MTSYSPDWREYGVRTVRHDQLDSRTPQTPGMYREGAISRASAGAERIWADTVTIQPGAKTGPHHHGALESVIYVLRGRARMRWVSGWSTPPKPAPVISFTSRRTCRTRRSTPAATSRSTASSCAATSSRSW